MAEGIARQLNNNGKISFKSMGTGCRPGMPADPSAVAVCREHGIDISSHIARGLSLPELIHAEKIFCMDRGHLKYISSLSPQISDKTILLTDFPSKRLFQKDIPDPFKKSLSVFRKNFEMIHRNLERIISHL